MTCNDCDNVAVADFCHHQLLNPSRQNRSSIFTSVTSGYGETENVIGCLEVTKSDKAA